MLMLWDISQYISNNYTASSSGETLCLQDGLEELGFPQNYNQIAATLVFPGYFC